MTQAFIALIACLVVAVECATEVTPVDTPDKADEPIFNRPFFVGVFNVGVIAEVKAAAEVAEVAEVAAGIEKVDLAPEPEPEAQPNTYISPYVAGVDAVLDAFIGEVTEMRNYGIKFDAESKLPSTFILPTEKSATFDKTDAPDIIALNAPIGRVDASEDHAVHFLKADRAAVQEYGRSIIKNVEEGSAEKEPTAFDESYIKAFYKEQESTPYHGVIYDSNAKPKMFYLPGKMAVVEETPGIITLGDNLFYLQANDEQLKAFRLERQIPAHWFAF